jgi:hypothetical protein
MAGVAPGQQPLNSKAAMDPDPPKPGVADGGVSRVVADDAALRRLSANAKVATPPPPGKKRIGEAATEDSPTAGRKDNVASDYSAGTAAMDSVADNGAEGATAADAGLNESLQSDFSELARAFTCMEVM